jgi:Lrp/AsnC family leucine-responsive transcriptional regulator
MACVSQLQPMDAMDKRLLNMLQVDSRLTAEQLGERLHLSPSAITRRVQRLWREGAISSQVVVLGDRLRSRLTSAVITVQLDRHHPSAADELRRSLRASPLVQVCLDITGTSDVLLVVSVRDMDHFNEFTDELAQMPLVRRYETHFVKRVVKFTTAVSLEED